MKVRVKTYIFAIALGLMSIGAAAKKDSKSLTSYQQKAFESYVLDQYAAFTEQEEWKIFVEVVTLYNQAPSKLKNIDKESKQLFENALQLLSHAMVQNGTPEARIWWEKLQITAHNVHFLCNSDWGSLLPVQDTEVNDGEPIRQLNGF